MAEVQGSWKVENSTLVYKIGDNEVATISGGLGSEIGNASYELDAATAARYVSVTEPTIDTTTTPSTVKTPGTITLKANALGKTAGSPIELTLKEDYAGYYALGLEGATSGVLTGETAEPAKWKIEDDSDNKKAVYYAAGTDETWTLGKTSSETGALNDKITYVARVENGSPIATIKGLKNGLTPGDYTGTDIKITAPTFEANGTTVKTLGTITIGNSVLPDSGTVALTATNYNLALASGVAVFDSTKGTPEVTKVEGTTATITRTQSAGWKAATDTNVKSFTYNNGTTPKTLATIRNLNKGITKVDSGNNAGKFGVTDSDGNFVEAITVNPTTKVVTLAKEALTKTEGTDNATTIVDGTGNNDADTAYKDFTLAISGANSSGKLGGGAIAKTWALDSSTPTTAYYKSDGTEEYWQLDKTTGSATLNKKITYTAEDTPTNLVTITNLNKDVVVPTEGTNKGKIGTTGTNGAFVEGITISGNSGSEKVTLKEAVLTTTEGEDGKMSLLSSYSFELATGIATEAKTGEITLGDVSAEHSLDVNQEVKAFWKLTDTKTITYTAPTSQIIGEITNLGNNAHTKEYTVTEGSSTVTKPANITLNTTTDKVTITLGADALTEVEDADKKITVAKKSTSVADSHDFELALASGIKAPETTPTADSIKLGKLDTETGEGKNTKQIEVYGTLAKGWTVDGDKKSITFKAAEDTTLATITGLVSGIYVNNEDGDNKGKIGIGNGTEFKEVITLDKTADTVKLAGAAIGTTDEAKATLKNGKQVGTFTPAYKLALLNKDTEAPGTRPEEIKLANLAQENGKETYQVKVVGQLAAGYKAEENTTDKTWEFAYVPVDDNKVLATITGLASGLSEGTGTNVGKIGKTVDSTFTELISLGTGDAAKTVTLKAGALTDGDVVITPNALAPTGYDTKYKLAVGDDVPYFGKTVKSEELDYADLKNGNVTIKGIKEKGWSLVTTGTDANRTIKFTNDATEKAVVATISGLKAETLAEGKTKSDNIDFAESSTTTVKLKQAALTKSNVTLTPNSTDYTKYKLALDSSTTKDDNDNPTLGFEAQNYWEKSNTTAKYYSNKTEGWTLDTTENSATKDRKITYTAQSKGTLLATITNLNANFTTGNAVTDEAGTTKYTSIGTGTYSTTQADNKFVEGVQVTDTNNDSVTDTITLSKNVLGTKEANVTTLTNSNEAAYVLALDTENGNDDLQVTTAGTEINVWELGATSKYKKVKQQFWTLGDSAEGKNSDKITYTAQEDVETFATITGLNPKVTETDLNNATIVAHEATTTGDGAEKKTTVTKKGTITLNAQALNKKGVTITGDYYELALNTTASDAQILNKVATPTLSNGKWSLNASKATATYTGNITEGYELANDHNSVIYTPKGTGKTIATVTGLNKDPNLTVSSDYQSIGVANNGSVTTALSFKKDGEDKPTKEIVLTSGVLGTSDIAVSGTNYTLALDSEDSAIKKNATEADVWRLSNNGTTATYKKVVLPYYTIAGADTYPTSITYHAETEATQTTGTGNDEVTKKLIYATVTGLKSGLTVKADGSAIVGKDDNNTEVDAVKLHESSSTQIDLDKAALGTTAITVTKGEGANADYTLSLGDAATTLAPKVDTDTYNWSLDSKTKTTAYLKANTKEGWTLGNSAQGKNNDQITYTRAATNKLFATLTGLKSGLTNTDLNGTANATTGTIEGAGITFTANTDTTKAIDATIKLNMRVLGEGTVALTVPTDSSNVYELAVDTENSDTNYQVNTSSTKETPIWEVSGTTATFKNVYAPYYTVGKNNTSDKVNNKITYTGQANLTGDTGLIMKLEGLKSGLKVVDNAIAGIDETSAGSKAYTISKDVLGTTNVKLTEGGKLDGRTFTLQADVAAPVEGGRYWTVSGTTAKYQYESKAGYTQTEANKDITYSAEKKGTTANTIATIEGLKSGVKKADVESGIVVVESAGTFKLSKDVLGTTDVSITKGNEAKSTNVTLELATGEGAPAAPDSNKTGWVVGTDSLTLKSYTTAGYTIPNDGDKKGKIVYSEGKLGTADSDVLAIVKGLKTNLKVKDIKTSGDIDGITVSGNDIILAKGVLNAKDVTIKNENSSTYALKLATDAAIKPDKPSYVPVWTAKNGTATLTETLNPGYTEDSTDGGIDYTPKEVLTTTISGLKKSGLTITKTNTEKDTLTGISFTKASEESTTPGGMVVEGSGEEAEQGDGGGTPTAVASIPKKGTFMLEDSVIAGDANIVITTKSSVKNSEFNYKVTLQNTSKLQTAGDSLKWYKNKETDTSAVYKEIIPIGYTKTSDYKITYNKTAADTVYATIKGIAKTATAEDLNNASTGITVTAPTTTTETDANGNSTTKAVTGKFNILSTDILGAGNVSITGNGDYKNYEFNITEAKFAVSDIKNENATWTYNSKSGGTASLVAGKTEGWEYKSATDHKTLKYTKATPKTIATVTNLVKGLELNNDGTKLMLKDSDDAVVSFAFDAADDKSGTAAAATATTPYKGKVTVSFSALNKKNVVVTPKVTGYNFTLDVDSSVTEPEDGETYWTSNGKGTIQYKVDTTEGYKLNSDTAATQLTYSKAKTTTLATISGLANAALAAKDSTKKVIPETAADQKLSTADIEGITVSAEPVMNEPDSKGKVTVKTLGTIELSDASILGTGKISVTGNYEFNTVDEEIDIDPQDPKWYFNGGTATYRKYNNAGYANNSKNAKVVEFKKETPTDTLVTIKGLLKKTSGGTTITNDNINTLNYLTVDNNNAITLNNAVVGKTTITLTEGKDKDGNYFDYTFADAYTTEVKTESDAPVWEYKNGTATLKQHTSEGHTLTTTTDKKDKTKISGYQLVYSKDVTPTVATVKGLASGLVIPDATEAEAAEGSVTAGKVYAKTTTGGKTTYTEVLKYDKDEKIITILDDGALAAKNVTMTTTKTDGYTLQLNSGVTHAATNVTEWVVSGTTANYKNYNKGYYSLNEKGNGVVYTKPKDITTYATVKGIASGSTIDTDNAWSGNETGGVLTLNKSNLGEKTITISSKVANNDKFLLAVNTTSGDSEAITSELSTLNKGSWSSVNGGKATLSGTQSAGFVQEFGGKQLTYNNNSKNVTIATITGLSNNASVSDTSGVVTLKKSDLNKKAVTITTSLGDTIYKLKLDSEVTQLNPDFDTTGGEKTEASPGKTEAVNKKVGWTFSGSTGTLKGYVPTAGYALSGGGFGDSSETGTAIIYTGETARNKAKVKNSNPVAYEYTYKDATTLATIKGVYSSGDGKLSTAPENGKISLNASNINGSTLTLSNGMFAVEIDSGVTGKSIVGSAGADNITANGTNLNITGGKGDDIINLGGSAGNTLVYNNGDGNDVVANFDFTNDKLQVKSGAVSVGKVGDDVVVKVGAGSINLGSSYTGTTIDILDKDNNKTTYAIAGAYTGATNNGNILLEDNNYSMDAANLSSLVQGDSASYTPYDFSSSFSLTKEDKLTPQISYSGSDKK